jgi:FMN phosphatase YigB (HAD superfamily)
LFDYVVASLGVEANSILFLDDNQMNIDAALSRGLQAELVKGVARAQEILYTYGVIK